MGGQEHWNRYSAYIRELRKALPVGQSLDVSERKIRIQGREASIFAVDGLVRAESMQFVLDFLMKLPEKNGEEGLNADDFLKSFFPFPDASAEDDMEVILRKIFTGLFAVVVDGLDRVLLMDARQYPMRGISEPTKEKSLRGAKDGFTEGFMTNIALVRRRIRDVNLIFESHIIGSGSRTDTCLVYRRDTADLRIVRRLGTLLDGIRIDSLTMTEQTLIEALVRTGEKKRWKKFLLHLNPFPKVRYTQRPDIVAAHVNEGKIAVIVDNTPTVILLPACIFDFTQDVDDYYFPLLTGNYFRMLRIINIFVTLFASPLYLLMAEEYLPVYEGIRFFIPDTDFAISIFWQFLILEVAIDGLKLASLNTPESLGMSLSVIGALILGEFSVESGWFIPQTILVMAVVALASFTQPSIEIGYAIKFSRILTLIGTSLFGFIGAAAAIVLLLAVMASTKTIIGTSYLYPLIPFDGSALRRYLFRASSPEPGGQSKFDQSSKPSML